MSLALIFSGQGTQYPAMLPWLDLQPAAAATLALMADVIGTDWRQRLVDPDWASRNQVAQPLLTGLSIAAWQTLADHLPEPAIIAGYSLGELPAFCVAGVFDADMALHLAGQRAQLMDRCSPGQQGGLTGVTGVTAQQMAGICDTHQLALAIRIAPDRCVLGGSHAALATALPLLTAIGAHCTPLAVQVSSHTSQMRAAAEQFAVLIEPMRFKPAQMLLVSNFSGAALNESKLKSALAGQISAMVRWDDCMETISERGVRCVLEIGPGSSLAKIWNSAYPEIPARSIDEFQSPQGIVRWVTSALR